MKIKGRKIDKPNIEIIVIPRGDGESIVFKAQAVLDYEPFRKLCPAPEAPRRMLPGGVMQENIEDKDYLLKLGEYQTLRMAWVMLESLKATEDLEWETIKADEPSTWANFTKELEESKFSNAEIQMIVDGVAAANALDEEKIEAARKSFLLSQVLPQST